MNQWTLIEHKVVHGERLTEQDALFLFESPDLLRLGKLADFANQKKNGKTVFYNVNRHINPTNICAMTCKFCAYSRKPGEEGGYEYSISEMVGKAREAVEAGATEVHMVGGLHPRWRFDYYKEMLRAIKTEFPQLHIKGFTAVEIDWLSRKARKSIKETIIELREAGLDSLPGGGAEIFHQEIRDAITAKLTAEEWLDVHRTAHGLGMKSNATMLYGHVESYIHRIDHMAHLRRLQDETRGFNAFIPLSFQPHQNEMGIERYTFGVDDLKTIAVARLFLDNFFHIKAYWIMSGQDIAQLAMQFGSNDLDGTVVEEKISRMAGGRSGMSMTKSMIENMIMRAGFKAQERDTIYNPIGKIQELPQRALDSDLEKNWEKISTEVSSGQRSFSKDDLLSLAKSHLFHELGILADKLTRKGARVDTAPNCEELHTASASFGSIVRVKEAKSEQDLLSLILKSFETSEVTEAKSLVLDLAEPLNHDDCIDLESIKKVIVQLKSLRPDLCLILGSLQGLWGMARSAGLELSPVVAELKTMGIESVVSSSFESESRLTPSELKHLHLVHHEAGMMTSGKVEISVPPNLEPPQWSAFIDRLLLFKDLASTTGKLQSLSVEPAKGSQVLVTEYLKAVAIARIALGSDMHITAPFLQIPSLAQVKGEGAMVSQHPQEKVVGITLKMGADDIGVIPIGQVSAKGLLEDIRSASLSPVMRNAAWQF